MSNSEINDYSCQYDGTKNYHDVSRSRYTNPVLDEKFDAIVQTIVEQKMERQCQYLEMKKYILDIDQSEGKSLDVIGNFVGQPRNLINFNIDPYFGFQGARNAQAFNVGKWYTLEGLSKGTIKVLTDAQYRNVIKARIIKNSTKNTRKDLIKVLSLLGGTDAPFKLRYPRHGVILIEVTNKNDPDGIVSYFLSRYMQDDTILPRPLGYRILVKNRVVGVKYEVVPMKRFDPVYWRVDGGSTASFSITNYLNGFEVQFQTRMSDDLVGIVWDSKDDKDHRYLAYETRYDYSGVKWEFDMELSESMPKFNDVSLSPTLTIHYEDSLGRKGISYIALWNYADEPDSRNTRIRLDFDNIRGGFGATSELNVKRITKMFFSGYTSNYNKDTVSPLAETNSGYVRVTNMELSGTNTVISRNRVIAEPHDVGMSTSYDDHYDLNPARIVDNLKALGYKGFLNHYCGMSHYPEMDWFDDPSGGRFRIPDPLVDEGAIVVNPPTSRWHVKFAEALNASNMTPIFSVSWELYSQAAREEWCQREFNDRLGKTGYTPPSYFASLCHENALAYLHKAYKEFGDTMVAGGCDVKLQIGEPWWWFNTDSLNPCVYDYQTRLAFNADTGLFAPDLGTITEAVEKNDPTSVAFKDWLRDKLGQTCRDFRTRIKEEFGESAEVCPLLFFPSILTHEPSLATYINYPKEHYAYPNFDFIMTEAYDWVIEQPPRLDLSHSAVGDIPIDDLGYPAEKVAYLSGFVPDKMIAYIYKLDYKKEYRSPIWQRILGDIKNNEPVGIMKQLVWAYPQVMFDSITIVEDGFYFGDTFLEVISDNTPYPDDIFGEGLRPPEPSNELQPEDVQVYSYESGDVRVTFDVVNDISGTTYSVQLLSNSGEDVLLSKDTSEHEVTFTSEEVVGSGIELSLVKVIVVPSVGIPSDIIDVFPIPA